MQYKRFNNMIFVRLDPEEEILEQLNDIAKKERIALANVNGIGAVKEFTTGAFDTVKKEYHSITTKGSYEIVSLTGTITAMMNEPYLHIHMSAGNENGEVVGGHLNCAIVSATAELVIYVSEGRIGRKFNEEIGLNLFDFFK